MLISLCKLAGAALLPVALAVLFTLYEKKADFAWLTGKAGQIVIGSAFGCAAAASVLMGVTLNGTVIIIRNAAPLTAGILFGAPAGVIAGAVGALCSLPLKAFDGGEMIALTGSVSIFMAGFFAAVLRKYMFDNKKPSWFYGMAIAIVMEDIHMLLLSLMNFADVRNAILLVNRCFVPMVFLNSLSVTLSVLAVSLILKKNRRKKTEKAVHIAQTFQRWLLLCVATAFLATLAFTFGLQSRLSDNDTRSLLSLNLEDVRNDISRASDENLLALTNTVADKINRDLSVDNELLHQLALEHKISEINIIDSNGIITFATTPEFIGYNMASGEQSSEFMVLLSGRAEYVSSYKPISYDEAISRKYAGAVLSNGGFVQVGYDAERFQKDIDDIVIGATRYRHVGQNGFLIICDAQGIIVSDRHDFEGKALATTGLVLNRDAVPENKIFKADVYGEKTLCTYCSSEGYTIIAAQPESEAMFSRDAAVYVMGLMEIIVFATMFALIYFLVKKLVVENIHKINSSLSKITGGNLDVMVDVRSNAEFASLSDDINSTVQTLKRYISEAEERIDRELEFARAIQHSALPSISALYKNRAEFDIWAEMYAAKEVGGDFYDFFFVDGETLAFLVADVSGKGIPAAMFMMTAKTLIKSFAESGMGADEVFYNANAKLCEGNDANMFVTAWMGLLNLRTGLISYVNAGHNPPAVRHSGGGFEYLTARSGLVLAARAASRYTKNEFKIEPGDEIFLYTDGVTEATNSKNELYGDDRLLNILNSSEKLDSQLLCADVKEDIDYFVGKAPQFDDITMLSLKYVSALKKGGGQNERDIT